MLSYHKRNASRVKTEARSHVIFRPTIRAHAELAPGTPVGLEWVIMQRLLLHADLHLFKNIKSKTFFGEKVKVGWLARKSRCLVIGAAVCGLLPNLQKPQAKKHVPDIKIISMQECHQITSRYRPAGPSQPRRRAADKQRTHV